MSPQPKTVMSNEKKLGAKKSKSTCQYDATRDFASRESDTYSLNVVPRDFEAA